MNDGYVTGWLLLTAAILLGTGWKSLLINGESVLYAYVFMAGLAVTLLLSSWHDVPNMPQGLIRSLPMIWAAAWSAGVLLCARSRLRAIYTLVCASIGSLLWAWLRYLYAADPVFYVWEPSMDTALSAGVVSALASARFKEQFAIVGIASLIGEGTAAAGAQWLWADHFLLALACARGISLALRGALLALAVLRSKFIFGKGSMERQGGRPGT